jgi:hypothetical protein
MKQLLQAGITSKRLTIFVPDSSSSVGAGLAGLTSSSSGLKWYYYRENGTASVSVTLASETLGTWTSGGFVAVDGTNMAGVYEIGIPNAILAAGASWAVMELSGATNMAPVRVEIQLVGFDPTDGGRLGLTDLPNGPMMVKKAQALTAFTFPMFNSSSHEMQTGLTVSCVVSKDGATPASSANAVSEIGNGFYSITFTSSETNCNVMALKFFASGADDLPYTLITQP